MIILQRINVLIFAALVVLAFSAKAETTSSPTPAWQPGELERVQISLQSYRYFQAIDQADYLAAFGTYASTASSRLKFKDWKQQHEFFRLQAGVEVTRNITRITWYPSPDAEDPSRMIAAASFTGKSSTILLLCGRLLWQRSAEGGFELIAEESRFISRSEAKTMNAEALLQRRDKMGCIGDV